MKEEIEYNLAMRKLIDVLPESIVSAIKDIESDYRKNYARIQIEKDRERVKANVNECGMYIDDRGLNNIYNQTPIILD